MFEALNSINLYMWIPLLLVPIMVIVVLIVRVRLGKGLLVDDILKTIGNAGYSYDPKQNIFYSNMDAWQRNMGYCRLYDEALAPLSMIIDCEPIYFEYDGKRWLLELWKGQYALTTGCEIGVYSTEESDLNIPDVFNGTFYHCASNEDRLPMSFSLEKNGEILFTRKDKHWWLTGFILGEFSEPAELTMKLNITLKNEQMRNAFVKGLENAGYLENKIIINGNTVNLKFAKPRTPQPITRTAKTDALMQMKNKLLCDKYQDITKPYDNILDKLKAIQEQSPEINEEIIQIGKTEKIINIYEKIKKYIN